MRSIVEWLGFEVPAFWLLVVALPTVIYLYADRVQRTRTNCPPEEGAVLRAMNVLNKSVTNVESQLDQVIQKLHGPQVDGVDALIEITGMGWRGGGQVAQVRIPDANEAEGWKLLYWPCDGMGNLIDREKLEELALMGKQPFEKAPTENMPPTELNRLLAREPFVQSDELRRLNESLKHAGRGRQE